MRRVALILLLLYSFAVPWEYSLDLGEPLGNVARILGLLLASAFVLLLMQRGWVHRPETVQWLVLAFYLYFVCSYFWTISEISTFEKMRTFLQVMMVVWLAWEVVESPMELRDVVRAFVAGCWVLAALTVLNFISATSSSVEQIRFVADGQDPNDVARFLDLGLPLSTLLFAVERRLSFRLLALMYIPVGLLAVLLTASRGGFFGAVMALLGCAALAVSWRPHWASVIFTSLAITLTALWLFVPIESVERLATIPQQISGGDLNDRLNIWTQGWSTFVRAPWFGWGAGTFALAAGLAPADTAHNTVMSVLVNGGLFGTALFIAILIATVWSVMRLEGLLRIAIGTVLAVLVLTSMVGTVEENRCTWLLITVALLCDRSAREHPSSVDRVFSGRRVKQIQATPALVAESN